jgi:hypothetical protein
MQAQPELQRLLQRHSEIQRAMRRPGGIRITVERELHAIREQLKIFPGVLQALQALQAEATNGPATVLSNH